MLKRLECQLELLTPAFLGGHEPRKLDEITPVRAHSVRGQLRWWFRAAAATLIWPANDTPQAREQAITDLRTVESLLFGDTKRISNLVVLPPEVDRNRCRVYPAPDAKSSPGLRYLGYGLFEERPPDAIYPGTFALTLGLRSVSKSVPELLGATLWLWTALGGLGARSRRGYGSLRLSKAATELGIPREHLSLPPRHSELLEQLRRGIDWVTEVFRKHLPTFMTSPLQSGRGPHLELRTLYGLQGPDALTVLPGMSGTGAEAMERMGRLFRDFRSTLRRHDLGMPPLPDYFAVKDSISSRRPPNSLERAAFGLPLPFYFRSLQGAKATFKPEDKDEDRLASPLLLRVHALETGPGRRYVATLINLVANELGDKGKYVHPLLGRALVSREQSDSFPAPSGLLLRQFTQWAKAEASKLQAERLGGRR